MPAMLDIGILNYFSIIFPALLVFALVFIILGRFKILGESKPLHSIIAIVMAILVMMSREIVEIINFISPWFVIVFIFGILLMITYMIMGVSEDTLSKYISNDRAINWLIFAIGFVIIIAGISHVYGQRLLTGTEGEVTTGGVTNVTYVRETPVGTTASSSFMGNVTAIFFNPKIIGVLFVLLLAVFTIALLAR